MTDLAVHIMRKTAGKEGKWLDLPETGLLSGGRLLLWSAEIEKRRKAFDGKMKKEKLPCHKMAEAAGYFTAEQKRSAPATKTPPGGE